MPAAPGLAECRRRAGTRVRAVSRGRSTLGAAGGWCCRYWEFAGERVGWRSESLRDTVGLLCSLPGKLGHLCCPQPSRVLSAAVAARGSRPFSGVRQNQTNFEGFRCGAGGLASQQCWWLCFWGPSLQSRCNRGEVWDPRGRQSSGTACKPTACGCLLSRTSRRGAR